MLDDIFEKNNYKEPQPFIKIFGKNIIEWILDYLDLNLYSKCIIIYNNQIYNNQIYNNLLTILNKYNIEIIFKYIEQNSNIIDSLIDVFENINIEESLMYIDTKFFYINNTLTFSDDNIIFFKNEENKNIINKNIYININNDNNNVIDILTHKKISNNLIVGSFIIKDLLQFKKYCKKLSRLNNLLFINNNIHITNILNLMLDDNIIFKGIKLTYDDIISLETPFHIRLFCNNFPKINAINNNVSISNKKICFDLKCLFEKFDLENNLFVANDLNINFIKYLKNIGNTIILTTNINETEDNKIRLKKIMDHYNIKYDNVYYNKPDADFYIDYNNILLDNNIEKNLGFYKNKIESRDFNDVVYKDIKTYKKISTDLSGEIHYYLNIPTEIKDIFPIMFNYDVDKKWYEMENINGIPISKLYLNEELTLEQFNHVLKTINRIHNCTYDVSNIHENINIYDNYVNKIINRYNNYDYSIFENNKNIYDFLIKELKNYQEKNMGKFSIIHGDTVFTNILINNFGKIKLIDMRGIINKTLTIYGDKMYDYAKIYQSLLGYDEILENIYVSDEYKNKFIKYFEDRFLNIFSETDFYYLKIITASLLFTLIPLHNNDKCMYYYKLIKNII